MVSIEDTRSRNDNKLYQTMPFKDLLLQSFFFSKSLTLSQYRRRPEFILNTVLKYNLKNKQISRPNPKIVYIYIQQISIEVFLLYENDYQTYGFFFSEKSIKRHINRNHLLASFSSCIFSSMSEWLFW